VGSPDDPVEIPGRDFDMDDALNALRVDRENCPEPAYPAALMMEAQEAVLAA